MRILVEESDARAVVGRVAKAIPARLRAPAFAVVAALLLADGKLEGRERRFLHGLGSELKLGQDIAFQIVDVVVLKNQL
jgi:hypothetical protein